MKFFSTFIFTLLGVLTLSESYAQSDESGRRCSIAQSLRNFMRAQDSTVEAPITGREADIAFGEIRSILQSPPSSYSRQDRLLTVLRDFHEMNPDEATGLFARSHSYISSSGIFDDFKGYKFFAQIVKKLNQSEELNEFEIFVVNVSKTFRFDSTSYEGVKRLLGHEGIKEIKNLSLHNVDLESFNFQELAKALPLQGIASLEILKSSMSKRVFSDILGLARGTELKSLTLRGIDESISEAISFKDIDRAIIPNLTALEVTESALGDIGGIELASALSLFPNLTRLNLEAIEMGDDAGLKLVEYLSEVPNLTFLNISRNFMTDKVGGPLIDRLESLPYLTDIGVMSNSFSQGTIISIGEIVYPDIVNRN